MKTINDLCRLICMPEEITTAVVEFDKQFDYNSINEFMERLCHRNIWNEALGEIKKVLGEDEKGIKILACMLKLACATYDKYADRKISDEIYAESMKSFTRFVNEHKVSYGTYGFDREWWTMRQASGILFRIGELEYELVDEDNKKTVALHIPSDSDMTRAKLEHSYKTAKKFLKDNFADYADVPMTCHSWLLSPTLQPMLSEDSHIMKFQNEFDITATGEEENGFAQWLFKNPKLEIKDFPEDTSLQRKMKQHLLNGGTVAEAKGILREPAFTE